jgi:hypothetical protein
MLNWLRHLLQMDAEEAVDLGPGEEILYVIGRHWVVLIGRLILPLLSLAFFGGLAFYRAAGGTFLVSEGAPVGFDVINYGIMLIVGILAVAWLALFVRSAKTGRTRTILLFVGAGLLLLTYYRYTGGRIFAIEPVLAGEQRGDTFNIVLILGAVISSLFVFFAFYDWLNDELILTNQRVVYDNDQVYIPRLLEQRVQEQIFLEDIQDVNAKTSTYAQHFLKYGTVTIKSARIGGNISFASAANPMEMQKQIMDQVKALRKRMSTANYDQLIEERVYGAKGGKKKYDLKVRQTRGSSALINWLFLENPEFDENSGTYTWHPHWLFQVKALIGPALLLVIGLFSVAIAASLLGFDAGLAAVLGAVVLLAAGGWTAWEIEDYRNDRYILSLTNVVDIEKKPFGPEDKRQAGLGAITNVSFSTTFVSNLLGYGDVILETAGAGGKFTFNRVPRPNEVVTVINDYIVSFKREDKARTLNDTLELLSRYHEAQRRHNELSSPPAAAD